MGTKKKAEFNYLKEMCDASAGNLSVQITKLEEAGYIKEYERGRNTTKKTFQGRRDAFLCLDGDMVFEFIGNQLMFNIDPEENQADHVPNVT